MTPNNNNRNRRWWPALWRWVEELPPAVGIGFVIVVGVIIAVWRGG